MNNAFRSRAAAAICAGALVFAWAVSPARARTLNNSELNFTFTVPDAYVDMTPLPDNAIYSMATSDPKAGTPDAVILVQRMHGTIGQEHLRAEDVKAWIPDATVSSGTWQQDTIDVLSGHMTKGGHTLAVSAAQIPLSGEAIQILVASPAGHEATADGVLRTCVAGLTGVSGWPAPGASATPNTLTPEQRGEKLGEGIVMLAAAVFGLFWLVRKATQKMKN